MTDIYLHFLFAHHGLYGNAPVHVSNTAPLVVFLAAPIGDLLVLPELVLWRVSQ